MKTTINLDTLKNEPRLLIEAKLKPIAGTRFQPTGFPDLGPATYNLPDGTPMLLVESAQSMANRLEAVCWDEAMDRIITELEGLPYVEATVDGAKTNSLLEAHRLNSAYIVNSPEFAQIEREIGFEKNKPFNRQRLVTALFKYDPSSLLHGVFLEKIGGGVRLPRALSAFIEARNVTVAPSGGVKFDRIQPETTGKVTPYGKADEGYGNVPYPREEFCGEIAAFFNLDLALVRGFGLGDEAKDLLVILALFKVQKFLAEALRIRTACDLELTNINVVRPTAWQLPTVDELRDALKESIEKNKPAFGPSPLSVKYDAKIAKARKAAKGKEQKKQRMEDDNAEPAENP